MFAIFHESGQLLDSKDELIIFVTMLGILIFLQIISISACVTRMLSITYSAIKPSYTHSLLRDAARLGPIPIKN